MDLKNKAYKNMQFRKQILLNSYLKFKIKFKKFIYKNIISIYLITKILIISSINILMRNQRIFELETKVKELEFEKNYINTIKNTVDDTVE